MNKLLFSILIILLFHPQVYPAVCDSSIHQDRAIPQFPGGEEAMLKFVQENLNIPSYINHEKSAIVVIQFDIDKEGSIDNIILAKRFDEECDKEAIRVVRSMPKWLPVLLNGKPISSTYTHAFNFSSYTRSSTIEKTNANLENNKDPEFPGGQEAMFNFVKENLSYPTKALKNKVEGLVIVKFKVSIKGELKNISIDKKLNKECDKEALRIVKAMPKWNPALEHGQPVEKEYFSPIVFKLP